MLMSESSQLEAVALQWLEDFGDSRTRIEGSTGALRRVMELQDEVVVTDPDDHYIVNTKHDLGVQPEIVDGDLAEVRVDGWLCHTEHHPTGEMAGRYDFSGPMRLKRTNEGWKVADFTLFGRSFIGGVFPNAKGSGALWGVGLEVLIGVLTARDSTLILRIHNKRDQPVGLPLAELHRRFHRDLASTVGGGITVPAYDSVTSAAWWWGASLPTRTKQLRTTISSYEGRSETWIPIEMNVDLGEAASL
jgi:hypothetical protein